MSAPIYTGVTGGAVALTAATAKTIIGVKSGAAFSLILKQVTIAFDGVTAAAAPVLVELCYCTWATNAPGTASTAITPLQGSGRVLAHGTTAAKTWTTEPTVLTTLEEMLLHPQAGLIYQVPLSDEYDCALGEGFAIRCTAPATVNVRATIKWQRA